MFLSDIDKIGYPVGTFKLGQKIYHIMNKEHRFKFHKSVNIAKVQDVYQLKVKNLHVLPARENMYIKK